MARSQFLDLLDGYEESEGRTHSLGKRFFVELALYRLRYNFRDGVIIC